MPDLNFHIEGAEPERGAAAPLMLFRLRISEQLPEGQDVAVILEAPGGRIVGASRL